MSHFLLWKLFFKSNCFHNLLLLALLRWFFYFLKHFIYMLKLKYENFNIRSALGYKPACCIFRLSLMMVFFLLFELCEVFFSFPLAFFLCYPILFHFYSTLSSFSPFVGSCPGSPISQDHRVRNSTSVPIRWWAVNAQLLLDWWGWSPSWFHLVIWSGPYSFLRKHLLAFWWCRGSGLSDSPLLLSAFLSTDTETW